MIKDITVVIRTINRPTLKNAIDSALREFSKVIVVADAVDLNFESLSKNVCFLKTGQRFDQFGSAAINMGAFATTTEYFCLLDDDDEFVEGAGKIMIDKINQYPSVDVWIPGLKYPNGQTACIDCNEIKTGNIAVPTYKTKIFFDFPFTCHVNVSNNPHWIDADFVKQLALRGYKIDWYNSILILIRPVLGGCHGLGNL